VRIRRAVESRAGRTDFVRCSLAWSDGMLWAEPVGAQVSGHLVPQSRAHGLLVVPEAADHLGEGGTATAIVWRLPESIG
jgi:molybdopterin biosynthesis enzyme